MDKFVCEKSKNDDDRSTNDQMSTPTLTSLDTKCEVAPSKQSKLQYLLIRFCSNT